MTKSLYFGTIQRDPRFKFILVRETGAPLVLELNGFNPAADEAMLAKIVGKRAAIEGVIDPCGPLLTLMTDSASIKLLPPKRTPRP